MSDVKLSIVISVKNDERHVVSSLDSICRNFLPRNAEIIVINDNSTDQTGDILRGYAQKDDRCRIVDKYNSRGLTEALICGCKIARGKYIARHDGGGDISVNNRFEKQLDVLERDRNVVLVAGGTRLVGPRKEHLYDVIQTSAQLSRNLRGKLKSGPSHHGCVMFRRDAYENVGGYRGQFKVAQDLDLWVRLAELGNCVSLTEILYEARLAARNISTLYRKQQLKLATLINECAIQRAKGHSENQLLKKAKKLSSHRIEYGQWQLRLVDARFYYFIGSVLERTHANVAKTYFRRAISAYPIHLRAVYKWLKYL